jgi:hypothetical protein
MRKTAEQQDRELAREIANAFVDPLFRRAQEKCEEKIFKALQGRRIMGANEAKIVDKLPFSLAWWSHPPEQRA